ncbi:MAG: hypothetical protein RBR06_08655 [Desulfuromonadaceae bacterium]|nr:hypothetical protein [Desulfuromonadaceae bacterium]
MASKAKARISFLIYDDPKWPEDAEVVKLLDFMERLSSAGAGGQANPKIANMTVKSILRKYAVQELALLKRNLMQELDMDTSDLQATIEDFEQRTGTDVGHVEPEPVPAAAPEYRSPEPQRPSADTSASQEVTEVEAKPEPELPSRQNEGQPDTQHKKNTPLFELASNLRRKRIQEEA